MSWLIKSFGAAHFAAIKEDGTLWTWGSNQYGQLGDGTTVDKSSPVQIGTDNDWSTVIAGDIHTIALKRDGSLYAWGGYGVLSDDSQSRLRPIKAESLKEFGRDLSD